MESASSAMALILSLCFLYSCSAAVEEARSWATSACASSHWACVDAIFSRISWRSSSCQCVYGVGGGSRGMER